MATAAVEFRDRPISPHPNLVTQNDSVEVAPYAGRGRLSVRPSFLIPMSRRLRSQVPTRPARRLIELLQILKHDTLELGGRSPNIVFSDADLDAAAAVKTSMNFYEVPSPFC
jgi:Aldehyde dehydrogenase family